MYYKFNNMGIIEKQDRTSASYWAEMKKKPYGRPKKIEDPEVLWQTCCEYFEWCANNPMLKPEMIRSGDMAGTIINIEVIRPFTWQGLENHLRGKELVAKLDDYRSNKNNSYDSFTDILTHVTQIIHEQKYTGALVGAYNPNLIARDLGMSEKTETTVKTEQPLFD